MNGQIPFIDLHTTPTGNGYALFEGGGGEVEGQYEDFGSSVVEVEHRPITEDELAAVAALAPAVAPFVHEIVGPRLQAMITETDPSELGLVEVETRVRIRKPAIDTVTMRLNRAIANGLIQTQADREAVRQTIMAEIAAELSDALAPTLADIESGGASPTVLGAYTTSVGATMTLEQVEELSAHPEITRIDLVTQGAVGGADGQDEAQALQYRLFWDEVFTCGGYPICNYDAINGLSRLYAAVMDPKEFRDQHVAFKDYTGTTVRIREMWDCTDWCSQPPCSPVCNQKSAGDWTPPVENHGTWVLGALLGDYRDGQDGNVTSTDAREQRSAPAGEARTYLYKGWDHDLPDVLSHVASRSPQPHLFVTSAGFPGSAPDFGDCNGDTALDGAVDDLFETGIGYFGLAGNDLENPPPEATWDSSGTDGSTSNCTAWDPTALTAFTIGAYDDNDGDICLMRASSVWKESAWGGADPAEDFNEGRGRTVIDLLGPWGGGPLPSYESNTATTSSVGTSYATPTVAGTALDFIDMMKNRRGSNMIDDPGMLYAWMLNNGDRAWASGSSNKLTSGYHSRYGAGRTNLRFLGDPGMDSPWQWYHWEVCVPHATVVTLNINGGSTLASDFDSFRATAWWYDRRYKNGTGLDNVNMYLKKTDGTNLRMSQHFFDNKERVHYKDIGGKAVKLELHGYNVTTDGEGCGTNSMRVWVTVMVEDDDRDDANGPGFDDPGTCEGVQTL